MEIWDSLVFTPTLAFNCQKGIYGYMNVCKEPPPKWLVDMNPLLNDVHQRVPYWTLTLIRDMVQRFAAWSWFLSAVRKATGIMISKKSPMTTANTGVCVCAMTLSGYYRDVPQTEPRRSHFTSKISRGVRAHLRDPKMTTAHRHISPLARPPPPPPPREKKTVVAKKEETEKRLTPAATSLFKQFRPLQNVDPETKRIFWAPPRKGTPGCFRLICREIVNMSLFIAVGGLCRRLQVRLQSISHPDIPFALVFHGCGSRPPDRRF